jgi:hypothetical protein
MPLTQNNVKKNWFFILKDFDKKPFFCIKRVGYNVRKVNRVNAVYYEKKGCISFVHVRNLDLKKIVQLEA